MEQPPNNNPNEWTKRVLIFTPTRGMIRAEWIQARYGQIIPTNWSHVELVQYINTYIPIGYLLADAQNLMAKVVVDGDYDWVIYLEDDNIIPANTFVKFNDLIREHKEPVVSGVYFTKGYPSEPLLYRGRGNSFYDDWKFGDKVRVDGIPFGCRLEDAKLIKEAWKDSPEYVVGNVATRRVFEQPTEMWYDQDKGGIASRIGTTDLNWCTRIMNDKLLERAGYPEHQKMKYPFLVDTSIFVKHIDQNGVQYPIEVDKRYVPEKK
jgi:hypothetical protein